MDTSKYGQNVVHTARENVGVVPLLKHAASGLVATGAMTAFMAGAKVTGLLRNPPPKHITKRAEQKVGMSPRHQDKETFNATWLAAHVAYGMGSGVVYGLVRGALPGPPWSSGLIYGGALWAISYLGVMPALGLYPFPSDDSRSRVAVMIAAHGVYGEALATVSDRLNS
jgi:hypothetical protein